ncbi:hypothetical protein TWF506_010546 [Arthrobotrys conoides]|uniref:Uncharacterized protein n=1 Tax=Arthrobotrys conoides TaxID=74498 RepID=A0AAN8RVJ9_9PEZI
MRVVKHLNSERDRVLQGEEGGVEHCVKQPEAICLPPPTASKKSTLMYGCRAVQILEKTENQYCSRIIWE